MHAGHWLADPRGEWDRRSERDPIWDSPSYLELHFGSEREPLFWGFPVLFRNFTSTGSSLQEQKERIGPVSVGTVSLVRRRGCVCYTPPIASDACESTKKSLRRTRRLVKNKTFKKCAPMVKVPTESGIRSKKGSRVFGSTGVDTPTA